MVSTFSPGLCPGLREEAAHAPAGTRRRMHCYSVHIQIHATSPFNSEYTTSLLTTGNVATEQRQFTRPRVIQVRTSTSTCRQAPVFKGAGTLLLAVSRKVLQGCTGWPRGILHVDAPAALFKSALPSSTKPMDRIRPVSGTLCMRMLIECTDLVVRELRLQIMVSLTYGI